MGQQQLLLIILGVIIVGIAIAVGLTMFTAQSVGSNRDALISDLTNLAADAYQHLVRPITMGGGGGVYDASKGGAGYSIPPSLISNENGSYVVATVTANDITFTATSAQYTTDSVTGTYGRDGKLTGSFSFAGPNFAGS
ncbi:MAG TPA: hypothetical protein VJB38_14025 [Bacteroidota bacterium]|nr:hypothetical protein [Bacteroidota bacterium]